jgi:hypothetical protein
VSGGIEAATKPARRNWAGFVAVSEPRNVASKHNGRSAKPHRFEAMPSMDEAFHTDAPVRKSSAERLAPYQGVPFDGRAAGVPATRAGVAAPASRTNELCRFPGQWCRRPTQESRFKNPTFVAKSLPCRRFSGGVRKLCGTLEHRLRAPAPGCMPPTEPPRNRRASVPRPPLGTSRHLADAAAAAGARDRSGHRGRRAVPCRACGAGLAA